MGRHGERGSAAVFVIGALAISIAVGVGVYLVIKDHRAEAAEAARNAPPEPEPTPTPSPDPPPEPEPPVAAPEVPTTPTVPADRAEADAVDPTSGMFGTPGIDGALDRDVIVQTVMATEAKLTKCFTDNATTGGVVRVMMMLNRRGGVTTIAASGVDDALDRCVENVLRPARFGKTTDGNPAKVVFPIAFATPTAGNDGACDEVACVLENYESPCCAKYRRPRPTEATLPDAPTRDELARVFRSISPKIQACASDAEFAGVMKLRVKIQPDGTVSEASVTDAAPGMGSCVARAARTMKFSASQSGAKVSFPYNVQ